MTYWLTDPQLFLYAKGTGSDDVHLWRCKKPASSSSSLVVPLKPDDFDYVETVTDYMELLANAIDWDETDYKRLVKYIFERRLLVNGQGFVIAELHKADEDGKKMVDDANVEVPAIYIGSLDVLALKPYIPKLRERPIPFRSVQILEDEDGKAAVMDKNFNIVTKLTARVDNLEGKVTKLTTCLATTKGNVTDLQSKNKTLEAENKTLDLNVKTLEAENNTLDSNVKTLEGKITKLTTDLATALNTSATLQRELNGVLENPYYKEVWMNDLTNTKWIGIEKLETYVRDKINIIKQKGTFTTDDDNSTNVRASYSYIVTINDDTMECKAFSLEDLTPNKGKARFLSGTWWSVSSQGKTYICRRLWEPRSSKLVFVSSINLYLCGHLPARAYVLDGQSLCSAGGRRKEVY